MDLQGRCPKNLKHIQSLGIKLQPKLTSFAPFLSLYQLQYLPNFSDTFDSLSGRSLQIFSMIAYQEFEISVV